MIEMEEQLDWGYMEIEPTPLPMGWGRCGAKSPDEACIESDEQQIPSHPSLQGLWASAALA